MVRGGVWQFVYDTNRPAFLERDLVGLGRSGFDAVVVKRCPFIWSEREQWVSPM